MLNYVWRSGYKHSNWIFLFSYSTFFFRELTQVVMLLSFLKLGHIKETSGSPDESSALLYCALKFCILDFADIPLQLVHLIVSAFLLSSFRLSILCSSSWFCYIFTLPTILFFRIRSCKYIFLRDEAWRSWIKGNHASYSPVFLGIVWWLCHCVTHPMVDLHSLSVQLVIKLNHFLMWVLS